jgi:hypothetical protein
MHAPTEPAAGPSGSGTVVLELGPGAGALVLHTPAEMNGAEIDISPLGEPGCRTHSAVRPRHVTGRTLYAAVYPGLAPAVYTIWRADGAPTMIVAVADGVVTTARWPEADDCFLRRSARAESAGAARSQRPAAPC